MTKEELLQTYFYIEDISGSANTVTIKKDYKSAPTLNLEYSTDGSTWTTKTMNNDATANTFTIPANGKLYLRGVNNGWGGTINGYHNKITCSGKHNVGGNVMSLLYGNEFIGKTTFPTTNPYVLRQLFYRNANLVNAKDLQLPATTLVTGCYYSMFEGCSGLTTTPELPATTLAHSCYYYMFYGCTNLTEAPELPATTLTQSCYQSMFLGCTNLTTAPELPATTLTQSCYQSMFLGCTNLTTAPELPATTLANSCYYYMFYGCSKLNNIKADFIDYSNTNGEFTNWVKNVSSTGTFVMNPEATYNPENIRGVNGIPTGWYVPLYNYFKITDVSGEDNVLTITKSSAETPEISLEYSYDSNVWNTVTFTELVCNIDLPANGIIYLRGNNDSLATSVENYHSITCRDNYTISDNIVSLLNSEDFILITELTNGFEFTKLFKDSTTLINVNKLELLPTTLSTSCYEGMFSGCTQLTASPTLPATTLAESCYESMFQGCSSLNNITVNLISYTNTNNEFKNWVSGVSEEGTLYLTNNVTYDIETIRGVNGVPEGWNIINPNYFYIEDISGSANTVTIKKQYSSAPTLNLEYSTDGSTWTTQTMQSGTSANTFTIPTNGKIYFRGVNSGWGENTGYYYNSITCSGQHNVGGNIMSLLYGSEFVGKTTFPTTNAYIFYHLFYNNTNLVNAKNLILPATTLAEGCYYSMFYGCSSLITAPELPATTLANSCYSGMFQNCSKLTTAPELPATTLAEGCYFWMFQNCSKLTTAPELPATTLAYQCYSGMFYNCSNLTTAPSILPATTLADSCYQYMFEGCTSLTTAPELPATTLANSCYSGMFRECSKLNYIKADFINYSNYNAEFSSWVNGVSSTGTFIMNPNATYNPEDIRGESGIPNNWVACKSNERVINVINNNDILGTVTGSGIYAIGETVTFTAVPTYKGKFVSWSDGNTDLTRTIEITEDLPYLFEYEHTAIFEEVHGIYFINESENTNVLTVTNTDKVLQYSVDNVNWNNIANNTTTTIEFSNSITIKGTNTSLDGVNFKTSELTLIEGNIMALLHGDNITTIGNVFPEGSINTFKGLSKDNVNLVDCSKLELPETTVEGCYSSMFQGCSSLEKAPELPSTELASSCYNSMFQGCSKLNLINASFINYSNQNNEFTNWVDGVAAEGTFKYNKDATFNPDEIRGVDGIPEGWLVKNNSVEYFYIEDISGQQNMIGITLDNVTMDFFAPQPTSDETTSDNPLDSWNHLNVEYSYDGIEWQSLNILEECMKNNSPVAVISLEANTKVYLRGINRGWNSFINNLEFFEQQIGASYEDMINEGWFMFWNWDENITCPINTILCGNKVKIGGNILSLKYGEEIPSEVTSEELEYSFMNLFNPDIIMGVYQPGPDVTHNVNPIVDASELILPDVVGSDCYSQMFSYCTNLTTAPELPATTLAPYCYQFMFHNCSNLTKAPELPATTLAEGCYMGMFLICSKLNYVKMGYKGYIENVEEYSLKSVTPVTVSEELPSVDFSAVSGMLYYVSETGTFVMAEGAQYDPYEFVPYTWLIKSIDYGVEILALDDDLTLTISKKGNIQNPISLRYSVDFRNWEYITEADLPYHIDTNYGIVLAGDNVSLEGIHIKGNSPYSMKGNIMCLLLGESGKEQGCTFPEGTTNNFKNLFLGDNFIEDISGLVFTETTVDNCYQHMFTGCTGITTLPQLTATNLSDSCYHGMFMGCDGLTKVVLPEAYLAPYAYSNMFLGCEYLNNVTVTYKEDVDETNYKGWLNGVSVNGNFTYNHTEEVDSSIITSNYYVPSNWSVNYNDPNAINYFYIEDISGEENTVCISNRMGLIGEIAWEETVDESLRSYMPINLEYSYDKITWESVIFPELTSDESSWYAQVPLPKDGIVYFRNLDTYCNPTLQIISELGITPEDDDYFDALDYFTYLFSYNINVINDGNIGGDIRTLSNGMDIENTPNNDIYSNLFSSIEGYDDILFENKIISAENLQLPATTLAEGCYANMFAECTSLTTAPELPATTLAPYCYVGMFMGCTQLTVSPALPATTLAEGCYANMFAGCESLTTAPSILPATTLTTGCYSMMFVACTSLTTAPELPATTLAVACYSQMFQGCISLTTAPELPATTLASNCYNNMFFGCSKLNYIKADFIEYNNTNNEFKNWVYGVSTTGTFVMNPNANYYPWNITGPDGIPEGWEVENAPALPQ